MGNRKRPRFSVALTLGLVICTIPAQAQPDSAPGPLMRAVHRNAARLAAMDILPANLPAIQEWARVTRLAPGTEILVEVRGAPAASRHIIKADESELIVLDLAGPPLTREVRRVLQEIATTHPEFFLRVSAGSQFVQGKVRVAPDGVFLADRKVAEIEQVVTRIPQPDVIVITTPLRRRGSIVGAVVGAGAGLVVGFEVAKRLVYHDGAAAWMTLSLAGLPLVGGALGYQADMRTNRDIIYQRKPDP